MLRSLCVFKLWSGHIWRQVKSTLALVVCGQKPLQRYDNICKLTSFANIIISTAIHKIAW